MTTFNQVKERHMKNLELYVPVVARVHGGTHPEFHDVHKLFKQLVEKMKLTNSKPDLQAEFLELRKTTDNYTVPSDVCESYEAVYNMLAELDQAYSG